MAVTEDVTPCSLVESLPNFRRNVLLLFLSPKSKSSKKQAALKIESVHSPETSVNFDYAASNPRRWYSTKNFFTVHC